MPAVTTENLTKRYHDRTAVDGLNLRLPRGAVSGFVGPNGAGKTTTIRMLLGLVAPSEGSGTILGEPLSRPERFLGRVGALIESPAFYPTMSGRRNLRVLAELGGIPHTRIDDVLGLVGLTERKDDAFRTYSLGMKQRLGVAAALLPSPDLLILDEPTNGLDPAGIRDMRRLLRSLADTGVTVFVSSHLLAEVEVICDHVVLITDGRIRYQGKLSELTASRHARLRVVPEHGSDLEALLAMTRRAGLSAEVVDGELRVDAPADRAAWMNRTAFSRGITLRALTVEESKLEDAFFALTTPGQEVAA